MNVNGSDDCDTLNDDGSSNHKGCLYHQRQQWHQRVIAFAGDDVNIWTLSYLPHAGGQLRNDDFERHYAYRMMKPAMGIAVCWALIGLLFIASDWDRLDTDTFYLALILRFAGVIHMLLAVLLFRRVSIAAIDSNGAIMVSLYRLRFYAIHALATPMVWTEVVRIITRSDRYLSPTGLPLVFLGEAACAPLLYRHFVPSFFILGLMETATEVYFYGMSEDVGLGAWSKLMVVVQCCIIAYLREVSERRLFGLALPLQSTTRWQSSSSGHSHGYSDDSSVGSAQQRLSDILPDMVFSESFSKLPDTPPRTSVSLGNAPPIDISDQQRGSLSLSHLQQPTTPPTRTGIYINSGHHHHNSMIASPSGTIRPVSSSFVLWYDNNQMASYRVALMMISFAISIFTIADYTMLYHDEYQWFIDATITRFCFMIPVMLITFALTFMTCNHGRNRYQLFISICALVTGLGAISHYTRHIPISNHSENEWAAVSNAYLNALLRYLTMICSSFRLRFAYGTVTVIIVFALTVLVTYLVTSALPLEFILFGVAYSCTGIWLARWNDSRHRLLHRALLARVNHINNLNSNDASSSPLADTTEQDYGYGPMSSSPSSLSSSRSMMLPSSPSSSSAQHHQSNTATGGSASSSRVTSSSRSKVTGPFGGSIIDFQLAASPRGGLVDDT